MQVLICMNNKIKMVLIERATVLFSYKIVQAWRTLLVYTAKTHTLFGSFEIITNQIN